MPMPVFVVSVGAFSAGELVQAFRRRRGSARVDVRAEALFRLLLLGGILLWPLSRVVAPGATIRAVLIGAILAWAGALLRWWSFVTLGRYFTVVVTTSTDQPVIGRGPYRVLRHPSYTGLLLVVAGVGLMAGNWAGAAGAFLLVLIGLVHRLRIEERALIATLGDRYRAFAAGRARLIPYVW
ncbi:isoprenylcysteine carboxylmethyltransferase family protein [Actinoplanes bogorensis]|uniref:Isoprenylcysteine carboxylmethyltransferase family protein n=1 Tax=Paractinoplanes bogorensis TaxID=1610840 RepID=A0ABS5Z972_9ACTN|nr:isoprenylcysteine carboxylmethyltransferase family protein [Actinoplanes bogorensis]MBU2671055.1 isoprenylcysteine carboxylmethyltransferase family protein [Actinoplanes bogorensis]